MSILDNPNSMRSIAILNKDANLNTEILNICKDFPEFQPRVLETRHAFVQYLNYELPEIDIINYSDSSIDISDTLEIIKDDPWLHFGGSIIIFEGETEANLLQRLGGVNLIALIHKSRLNVYLPRVFHILHSNRSILFQRDIHALLQSNLSGRFIIDNNPFDASTYANLLANFLFNSNMIDIDQKDGFYSSLMELIINAIEHGNCEITYDEKTEFLAHTPDMLELIALKNRAPEVSQRRVRLEYRISPEQSYFTITDEGAGFDWQTQLQHMEAPVDDMHGRGILMATHFLGKLLYNDKGNQVSFTLRHNETQANIIPTVFHDQEEISFQKGDQVFIQGEKSSFLYYIISGRYAIIANDRQVSTLTAADIFLGEMSFLLNNKRSATVMCESAGRCIKVSKEAFINAIKRHPHYGIFLARMLAQRLDQLHYTSV